MKQKYIPSKDGYKICHRCIKELPATKEYFSSCKSEKDGLHRYCKECWKLIRSDVRNNREKANEYANKFKVNHREEAKRYIKSYRKTEQGKLNDLRHLYKRKTIQNNLPNTLTIQEWDNCKEYFNNRCAYCGKELPLEKEHFVALTKGGEFTKNNIIPSCRACNINKHNKDFFKWYKKQSFYSKKQEDKILKYLGYKGHIQQLNLL